MATIYPSLDTIKNYRVKPTAGEIAALNFLHKNLDDSYEIFFQPFLNGDLPDIVILRENSGAYILEVKDWNLDLYSLDQYKRWYVNTGKENQLIKSPLQQVFSYKENLFNLHIDGLLEKKINNPKLLSVVSCGIYFHNAPTKELENFVRTETDNDRKNKDKFEKYIGFTNHFDLIGSDGMTIEKWKSVLSRNWLDRQSRYFDSELYKSFRRHLKPPTHKEEEGKNIIYSDEQQKIITSKAKSWQKVKGVAGSGKTLCLAKRAVNAHLRHKSPILILTFNISLRNYIHDRISEVRENFKWENFHIVHYHEFFKNQANNFNLPVKMGSWEDQKFFLNVKDEIAKYKTILIDEIQDYQKEWVNIITDYFLDGGDGEYVAYGDEKQNIYKRIYDIQEKKPYTRIGGNWNLLKKSYRITTDIARLAQNFQIDFFSKRYELDEMLITRDLFDTSQLIYYYKSTADFDWVMSVYRTFAENKSIHENDICFQCSTVEDMRELDFKIRKKFNCKTNTMFETKEVYIKLASDLGLHETDLLKLPPILKKAKHNFQLTTEENEMVKKYYELKKMIEDIRRNKKFNFYNNRGYLKMSTIHSFKGWEVNTLFLIIDKEVLETNDVEFSTEELIYTAITRCQQNLVVINFNNPHYHEFFEKMIGITN